MKMGSHKPALCIGLLLIVLVTLAVGAIPKSCDIPIAFKHHYRHQWPLVFTPDGELYPTKGVHEERTVSVENGAEVLLSCGPNYLKNFNKKEVLSVRCNGASGNFSVIGGVSGSEMSADKFVCDLRVVEEILSPVDGCTNEKWTATSFGYVDPMDKMAVIVGEACYDTTAGTTIFAHVKLGDKTSSQYLQKAEKTLLTRSRHPDIHYKIELFRGLHFDEIYERIRIQLKTDRAPPLRMANFVDELLLSNAQLQAVKKLGWNYYVVHDELEVLQTLKADIHSLSENLDLDVFVGSHGVKTLLGNTANEKMELYLQQAPLRFPMPELIWIVVKHEERAMAFGVFNEETENTLTDVTERPMSKMCASDCSSVTWLKQTLQDGVNRQPLICCAYADFKQTVQEVPELTKVKELLL